VTDGRDGGRQGAASDLGPTRVTGALDGVLACARFGGRDGSGAAVDDQGRVARTAQ
jgi:hypothetical protein